MSQKQETPNLLETLTWEEFQLWLDNRFSLHHLVFWDGMKLLEFTQGDNRGSLVTYVHDFNWMLITIPLKYEYAQKLIFLHGSKPFVQKIGISNICQGLMKMVECMEDEGPTRP
jgi:hypothetical protein